MSLVRHGITPTDFALLAFDRDGLIHFSDELVSLEMNDWKVIICLPMLGYSLIREGLLPADLGRGRGCVRDGGAGRQRGGAVRARRPRKALLQRHRPDHRRSERPHGEWERAIPLPDRVQEEQMSADFVNGVLTVHLPKAPSTQPRQIPISETAS